MFQRGIPSPVIPFWVSKRFVAKEYVSIIHIFNTLTWLHAEESVAILELLQWPFWPNSLSFSASVIVVTHLVKFSKAWTKKSVTAASWLGLEIQKHSVCSKQRRQTYTMNTTVLKCCHTLPIFSTTDNLNSNQWASFFLCPSDPRTCLPREFPDKPLAMWAEGNPNCLFVLRDPKVRSKRVKLIGLLQYVMLQPAF